ncbi:MAG: hypothetical protein IJ043_10210 [Clostridia bacterium]|nr:hypothetical protein [Clostridia bacterium]
MHLTTEEIIRFAMIDQINEETVALAKKVNSHIAVCDACLEKVQAYQAVQEALARTKVRPGGDGDKEIDR